MLWRESKWSNACKCISQNARHVVDVVITAVTISAIIVIHGYIKQMREFKLSFSD